MLKVVPFGSEGSRGNLPQDDTLGDQREPLVLALALQVSSILKERVKVVVVLAPLAVLSQHGVRECEEEEEVLKDE